MATVTSNLRENALTYSPETTDETFRDSYTYVHVKDTRYFTAKKSHPNTYYVLLSSAEKGFGFPESKRETGTLVYDTVSYVLSRDEGTKQLAERKLDRLEEKLNSLISSTWNYLFSQRDIADMDEVSQGMTEDTVKIRELLKKLGVKESIN